MLPRVYQTLVPALVTLLSVSSVARGEDAAASDPGSTVISSSSDTPPAISSNSDAPSTSLSSVKGTARPIRSTWSTATHLGYALHQDSTANFKAAVGSILFLDVSHTVSDQLEVGLRTTAQGGKELGRAYYRLAAGPLLTWSPSARWSLQLAAQRYKESGETEAGVPQYLGSGTALQLGWMRRMPLGDRAELSWGGFLIRHQGQAQAAPEGSWSAAASLGSGVARGLEVALKFLM